MLRRFVATMLMGSILIFGTAAFAQDAAEGQGGAPDVTYKKKTVYDFEDDLVEGELQRPDGENIMTRTKAKHSSLIKIRENFIPEMLKSAENI